MRKPSVLLLILLLACNCSSNKNSNVGIDSTSGLNRYAERFSIRKEATFTLLEVSEPWQSSRGETYSYLLGNDPEKVPDSLSHIPFIKIPVERVIVFSTTHVAMLSELDQRESLCGASNVDYIYDPVLRERDRVGLLKEIGYDQSLNYEIIVGLDPDVLFLYGVEGAVSSVARKLSGLGIPVVYCAEYLERHPLGKAEWIRFFGSFYEMEDEAGNIFGQIDSSYCLLQELCADMENKPRVLSGFPWKDTWYIPGGNSFAARLIRDAGGDYLWKEHPSSEAVAMDLESVFSRAVEADLWINPGTAQDLESIRAYDARFTHLGAFSRDRVFNNNARMSPGGGNDYWESGTIRPDLVLADLIKVIHPELIPDHELIYYRELK